MTATYDTGILEVRVVVGEAEPKTREIPIAIGTASPPSPKKS